MWHPSTRPLLLAVEQKRSTTKAIIDAPSRMPRNLGIKSAPDSLKATKREQAPTGRPRPQSIWECTKTGDLNTVVVVVVVVAE